MTSIIFCSPIVRSTKCHHIVSYAFHTLCIFVTVEGRTPILDRCRICSLIMSNCFMSNLNLNSWPIHNAFFRFVLLSALCTFIQNYVLKCSYLLLLLMRARSHLYPERLFICGHLGLYEVHKYILRRFPHKISSIIYVLVVDDRWMIWRRHLIQLQLCKLWWTWILRQIVWRKQVVIRGIC